jgi:NADH-quinone oxidoreductase subunit L
VFLPAEELLGIHLPEYELFGVDGFLILTSVGFAALGIGLGIWLFGFFRSRARPETVERLSQRNRLSRALYTASFSKWWFDDLNHLLFYRFGGAVANAVMWFDVRVIDGVVNGTGAATQAAGDRIRRVQTGRVQNYALGIAIGLVVMVGLFILLAR